MTSATKYPPAVLADDYLEKLKAVPKRAFWADEDEPMYRIPPGGSMCYPHRAALKFGLIVVCEEVTQ